MARHSLAQDELMMNSLLTPQRVDVLFTSVFARTNESEKRIIVSRGGAGSSKSYSMCQDIWSKFLTERKKKILIVRKTLPALRNSVLPAMREVGSAMGVMDRIYEEKVMLNWHYGDNLVHFGSVDDPEKIKSTDWSYIWMEEATDFTFNDYLILKTRLRTKSADQKRNKMFLTLNPIDEYHWIKTELIDKEFKEVEDIASTYKDNPFLDQDYIDDLEKLANQDANFYRIYTLGEWGRLTNLIYTNWQIIDKFPATCDNIIYGIDFGYNAPSVLLKLGIEGNKVYEHQLIYKNHLTNKDFIVEMKKVIPPKLRMKPIYADSAEPDRIEEIRKAGFNIRGANKKVREGIDFIKRLEVYVTEDSTDAIKEKRGYSWRTDKKGRVIDEPVAFLDHAQDAERYAIYSHLKGVAEYRVRYA